MRAQGANFLLCIVVGSHTCEALGCLCSASECAFHLVKVSFQYLIPNKVTTSLVTSKSTIAVSALKAHGAIFCIEIFVIKFPDFNANFES